MKGLRRNFTPFYYALYVGKTAVIDSNGNRTGEYNLTYGNLTLAKGNISAGRGLADLEQFGVDIHYNKTVYIDNINCPINENAKLWLGYGIVNEFSETATYSAGSLVLHSGKMYCRKNGTPSTASAWVASYWLEIPYNYVVASESKALPSGGVVYAIREVDKA